LDVTARLHSVHVSTQYVFAGRLPAIEDPNAPSFQLLQITPSLLTPVPRCFHA
jgi:hypothetical protein